MPFKLHDSGDCLFGVLDTQMSVHMYMLQPQLQQLLQQHSVAAANSCGQHGSNAADM